MVINVMTPGDLNGYSVLYRSRCPVLPTVSEALTAVVVSAALDAPSGHVSHGSIP